MTHREEVMQAFAPLWCHTHQCQPFFSTAPCTRILNTDIGAQCTLHTQGSVVHKPYPTFSSTASSLNPVWCTGWKSADRGKVKCWGCFEFCRANINVKLALIVKYLFTVNKCIICKNCLFQTAIFLPQTCLDHGQTKPILVVLRLPSNPHGAEYECETLPQEERLFMTVAPQSGTYEAAQCNLEHCCCSALQSRSVNVRVIMVGPGKDSWSALVTLSLPRSCYYCNLLLQSFHCRSLVRQSVTSLWKSAASVIEQQTLKIEILCSYHSDPHFNSVDKTLIVFRIPGS